MVMYTYLINNLSEPDFDGAALQPLLSCRVVNEFRQFALSHLARSVSKDKQQCVDCITLSTSIRTDNGAKRLVEWTDLLTAGV